MFGLLPPITSLHGNEVHITLGSLQFVTALTSLTGLPVTSPLDQNICRFADPGAATTRLRYFLDRLRGHKDETTHCVEKPTRLTTAFQVSRSRMMKSVVSAGDIGFANVPSA